MNTKLLGLATFVTCAAGAAMAEEGRDRFVRVAELEIDPAPADAFATATPCASGCAGGLRRAGAGYCFLRPPRTSAARIRGNMRLFPGAGGE